MLPTRWRNPIEGAQSFLGWISLKINYCKDGVGMELKRGVVRWIYLLIPSHRIDVVGRMSSSFVGVVEAVSAQCLRIHWEAPFGYLASSYTGSAVIDFGSVFGCGPVLRSG